MHSKFKLTMLTLLTSAALFGCNDDSESSVPPTDWTNIDPAPPPPPPPTDWINIDPALPEKPTIEECEEVVFANAQKNSKLKINWGRLNLSKLAVILELKSYRIKIFC